MDILIYGITNSVTLALMAIGFSLTFGISGVAKCARWAFFLLGGILTWIFINQLGIPFFLSALISIALVGLLGFGLYWGLMLRLRGLAINEVIATLATAIVVIEILRWLGFSGFTYVLPEFIKGSVKIGNVWLDYQRIFLVGIGVALIIFFYLFTHRTKVGLSFRAIAQNERTAISLGIDSDWTAALSLFFGSALEVVAGVAILPLGAIDTGVGYDNP